MENETVLSVSGLHKSYKKIKALNGVSFDVPKGSVFGILGPNGSGKTTLLGVVLDVLKEFQGSYAWKGYTTHAEARKAIGAFLETPNFYHYLSAEANLRIVAEIKGITTVDIDGVLKMVGLYDRRNSKFSTYSLGMKQRLSIASSLLSNPEIIVLDEPTNGLDPEGIVEIRNLIIQLREEGKTLIIASHLLDEVEKVCTHVAILRKGDLLSCGPVGQILTEDAVLTLNSGDNARLLELIKKHPNHKTARQIDNRVEATFTEEITPESINQYCFQSGIALSHLSMNKQRLESAFLEMIKN